MLLFSLPQQNNDNDDHGDDNNDNDNDSSLATTNGTKHNDKDDDDDGDNDNDNDDGDDSTTCTSSRSTRRRSTQDNTFTFTATPSRPLPPTTNTKTTRTATATASSSSSSVPYRPGSLMAATLEQGRVPYGEESRKYRRTIFSHTDWVEHRNKERRIVTNLKGIFFSGIVRQLQNEVLLVTAVAITVVLWNDILVPAGMVALSSSSSSLLSSQSFQQHLPLLTLPSLPFTLSSPALGLLLVFRTNASYARWLEARNTWAKIVSNSRNIMRMAATFTTMGNHNNNNNNNSNDDDDDDDDDVSCLEHNQMALQQLGFDVWLFCRTLMNQLLGPQDEDDYLFEIAETLSATKTASATTTKTTSLNDCDDIIHAPDRAMAALARLSMSLDQNIPIDEKRRVEIDKSIVLLGDCMAICEKIFASPVPLIYTRHTARFLSLWMLLLPTAFYHTFADAATAAATVIESTTATTTSTSAAAAATATATTTPLFLLSLLHVPPGFGLIPASAIVSLFLFGIAELAVQLEEPFSILPLQSFCDSVKSSTMAIPDYCITQHCRHHDQKQEQQQT